MVVQTDLKHLHILVWKISSLGLVVYTLPFIMMNGFCFAIKKSTNKVVLPIFYSFFCFHFQLKFALAFDDLIQQPQQQ